MDISAERDAIAKLANPNWKPGAKKQIGVGDLAGGGKLAPAKLPGKLPNSADDKKGKKKAKQPAKKIDADDAQDTYSARGVVKIAKANEERQTVTGVVLQPETTDGQGDIISVDVVAEAAHKFLAAFNRKTKLGLQHKDFKQGRFQLVESFLAPIDMVIGSTTVKAGSWIMTVKVLDTKIWQAIKDGKVTGFSIGGVAKVQQLEK